MSKSVGAAMILLSAWALGWMPLVQLQARQAMLEQWLGVLVHMKGELRSQLSDLPTLLEHSLHECSGDVLSALSEVLETITAHGTAHFSSCWNERVSHHCYILTPTEQTALCELGKVLGNYLLEDELEAIERACVMLSAGRKSCKEMVKERSKLYLSTATAVGLIAIVMFI